MGVRRRGVVSPNIGCSWCPFRGGLFSRIIRPNRYTGESPRRPVGGPIPSAAGGADKYPKGSFFCCHPPWLAAGVQGTHCRFSPLSGRSPQSPLAWRQRSRQLLKLHVLSLHSGRRIQPVKSVDAPSELFTEAYDLIGVVVHLHPSQLAFVQNISGSHRWSLGCASAG